MNFADMMANNRRAAKMNDDLCPTCREPGNPKVHDVGVWHYKCTTPDCDIAYYAPYTTYTEKRLSAADAAAMDARIREEVRRDLADKIWIHQGNCSRTIPNTDPIPDGWSTTPTD